MCHSTICTWHSIISFKPALSDQVLLLVDNNGYTQINDDDGTDSRLYLGNTISGTVANGPNNGLLIDYAGINAYIVNYENGGDFTFQTVTFAMQEVTLPSYIR